MGVLSGSQAGDLRPAHGRLIRMGIHKELTDRTRAVMPSWLALYYDEPIAIDRGEGRTDDARCSPPTTRHDHEACQAHRRRYRDVTRGPGVEGNVVAFKQFWAREHLLEYLGRHHRSGHRDARSQRESPAPPRQRDENDRASQRRQAGPGHEPQNIVRACPDLSRLGLTTLEGHRVVSLTSLGVDGEDLERDRQENRQECCRHQATQDLSTTVRRISV